MKIWRVNRNDDIGYDEYDCYVCAAETESDALAMHEMGSYKDLTVTELGTANDRIVGVLCESFHAG